MQEFVFCSVSLASRVGADASHGSGGGATITQSFARPEPRPRFIPEASVNAGSEASDVVYESTCFSDKHDESEAKTRLRHG